MSSVESKEERLCAVIYARFSSHSQKEASIDQQIRECREYAKLHNINIVGIYADRAITGRTDRRPEFQRMIKDSAKHRFQYVIVYSLDRFCRNRYDSATYKTALKRNGVRVLSAKENIADGPEGIILESVLEGMAEYYSAELSRKIRRGMEDNARKCLVNSGNFPLGYKKGPDCKYAIDEHGAEIVRFIFNSYDEGMQMQTIADILNAAGERTSAGKPFQKSTISGILKNEAYLGIYKYGDIRIEGGIPRIIEDAQFFRVQKKLAENRKHLSKKEEAVQYLLTGKLFCGSCGAPMVGDSGTSRNGQRYRYYTCVNRKNRRTCKKKPLSQDRIEKAVLDYTLKFVLTDDVIEKVADAAMEVQRKDEESSLLKSLEAELASVRKQLCNINNAIAKGIFSSSTKEKLLELEASESEILNQIDAESIEKPHLEREQIIFWLNRFRSGSDSSSSRLQIIETFINSIYVFDDHLLLCYNFSADKKKISLDNIIEADFSPSPCSDGSSMVETHGLEPVTSCV